jgi:hypothetical protein
MTSDEDGFYMKIVDLQLLVLSFSFDDVKMLKKNYIKFQHQNDRI